MQTQPANECVRSEIAADICRRAFYALKASADTQQPMAQVLWWLIW